jgi:hypothetical protein
VERDPFAFAGVNARTTAEARQARDQLATRLGLGTDDVAILKASPAWSALATFCVESPLNISWYDAKISSWRTRRGIFIVACIAVLAIVLVALAQGGFSESRIAQVSAAVAALAACWRILAGAADVRTQLGGFWRARADLKEAFLTFEQAWSGKVISDGKVHDGFETALWQEITNARQVVRAERDTYFSTFNGTETLLETTASGISDVLARARDVHDVKVLPRLTAVAEARRKLDEARADELAQRRLLELYADKPANLDEASWRQARADAERARIAALAEMARWDELLRASAKASTLNPS